MAADSIFLISLFTALAVWIAIGVLSPRMPSELACSQCDGPLLPQSTRRGVSDVAVCSACGAGVTPAPVVLEGDLSEHSDIGP